MPTLFPFYLNIAAKVTVSDFLGAVSFEIENLDGTGLFMEWNVERRLSTQADSGTVRIYNLGKLQQGKIQSIIKASAGFGAGIGNIEIAIGWDGLTFSLMKAQIWKLQAKLFEDPDVVTQIEFGDGIQSNRDSQPLDTALLGVTIVQMLEILAKKFSPPRKLDFAQVVAAVKTSPNGDRAIGYDGTGLSAKQTFDVIVSGLGADYTWGYGLNGLIVVYNRGQLTIDPGTLPELIQPSTGLLNVTEEDNGSVSLDSLANPSVLPGTPVAIVDRFAKPVGQPVMRTESAVFTGDTRTSSLMRVVARPLSVI